MVDRLMFVYCNNLLHKSSENSSLILLNISSSNCGDCKPENSVIDEMINHTQTNILKTHAGLYAKCLHLLREQITHKEPINLLTQATKYIIFGQYLV